MTTPPADAGGPGIILNLAGEGEVESAIDINSLIFPLRPPDRWVLARRFIQADITALSVRGELAREVVGRKLPMMTDEDRRVIVEEAIRVLIPGGLLRLHSSSGGGVPWLHAFEAAGLSAGTLEGIYATGVKPR